METVRVQIKPELLRWATERSGAEPGDLAKRFPKLRDWERGDPSPTLKQVEEFARAVYVPVGFLFLSVPPVEQVPIPDFRTAGNARIGHPSPNLLDTLYICQHRQDWFRDFERSSGGTALPFVGSARLSDAVETVAASMREALGLSLEERGRMPTWTDALRRFIEQADGLGVLVMCSGVVQNNTHRRLDPEEFRGFALADDLAPLVFINGADTKAAQMFTLAHELAHIWLGQSALSDGEAARVPDHATEGWCNRVAAELLVPLAILRKEYRHEENLFAQAERLARRFKVSKLVVLRRIYDAGHLTRDEFWAAYRAELDFLRGLPKGSGGNFYLTQAARVSKRFARALLVSTLEGQTLYRDAFRMLGIRKEATFREMGAQLGFPV
jgi:Zn-dependent peptidase ImmA (M78 family)